MVLKRKTFFRIVAALITAAVILGAIDVQLIRRLREPDAAPAIQAIVPLSPTQISADEEDPDPESSCHVEAPPKELPRLSARME